MEIGDRVSFSVHVGQWAEPSARVGEVMATGVTSLNGVHLLGCELPAVIVRTVLGEWWTVPESGCEVLPVAETWELSALLRGRRWFWELPRDLQLRVLDVKAAELLDAWLDAHDCDPDADFELENMARVMLFGPEARLVDDSTEDSEWIGTCDHDCEWSHDYDSESLLGDAYYCSRCGAITQVG